MPHGPRIQLALFLTTFAALMPRSADALEPRTWELRDGGRWQEVRGAATQPVARDEVLDRVESLLDRGEGDGAKDLLLPWIKSHPEAANRDRAVFLLANANLILGERIAAFYNLDELLDYYPASPWYYRALEKQYQIADVYLNGAMDKFLFFRIVGREDEAVEMLYRIQQRSPGSPLAEKALLRTADYYYNDGAFDLASLVFQHYVRTYPRSPNVPQAKLKQAFSTLAQFRGVRFDATPVIDARQQLVDLMTTNPELAEKEKLGDIVERLDRTLSSKLFVTAQFLERTHQPQAAAYYYGVIARSYPDSPEAAGARDRISAIGANGEPATLPAAIPVLPPIERIPSTTSARPTTSP